MKYARFEDLPVWNAAAQLFLRVDKISQHPGFQGTGDKRDQLLRATLSVSNNIAECFELGTTDQLITFLYYARGSAGETRSMLRIMERMDKFADAKAEVCAVATLAENISRQLRGWLDSLQNSDIKGPRYLNDALREKYDREKRAQAFMDTVRKINFEQSPSKGLNQNSEASRHG
jgi:four helix bundle protein